MQQSPQVLLECPAPPATLLGPSDARWRVRGVPTASIATPFRCELLGVRSGSENHKFQAGRASRDRQLKRCSGWAAHYPAYSLTGRTCPAHHLLRRHSAKHRGCGQCRQRPIPTGSPISAT